MKKPRLFALAIPVVVAAAAGSWTAAAGTGPGVGNIPQGTQSTSAYAKSFKTSQATNVDATAQKTSCYRPENPFFVNLGPNDGYTGMTACAGASSGEDIGSTPYPSQATSNAGYPATSPMLVKDHSESDIRIDPTNPLHLIASSKWVVSAEGYNHLLGFYESWDGGKTWPVQGHIPGYEGWTDNTDPVGAFDTYGNYYEFILPYEFYYNADGSHNSKTNQKLEPNPVVPAEEVSVAVRPHGATAASDWLTTHNGQPDVIASYDSLGNEPDKQWITIDDSVVSPYRNRVYAMWVDFHFNPPVPFVSFAKANPDGTHTDWSKPDRLPEAANTPQGATYLLPHVAPNGDIYTTLTNFTPQGRTYNATIALDRSVDGGVTWKTVSTVVSNVVSPPLHYANTTFRDGIENSFAVGQQLVNGQYPVYVAWEDYSTGVTNVIMSASYDGGMTWSAPIQVNDNQWAVDEFQPNLAAAPNGTVSVNFYDRRLACPSQGTSEAAGAGIALDQSNPVYSGSMPPYGATNYCVNSSIQFYTATLAPMGHNIRISQHTWDPQLNSPHPYASSDSTGFIGDYFGNTISANSAVDYTSSVSTYDDGSNPAHYQQQVVATVPVP